MMVYVLCYLTIGVILYFGLCDKRSFEEYLRKDYISYRLEEIARGNQYLNESTYRKIMTAIVFCISLVAWPYILYSSIK